MLVIESLTELNDYVGKELAVSNWLAVTQDRINQFAAATEDRQWIHVDPERAKRESPFGATIAHGFLTLALISHLMQGALQIRDGMRLAVNYGLNRVRFVSPVRQGSKIRGRFQLLSWKDLGEAFEAVYACTIECAGSEKPACVAEWIVRYYK
jgi:acyl dehydratase